MASKRAAWVAGEQFGVIGKRQILNCGITETTIRRWRDSGRLHPHPFLTAIYLWGHTHIPPEAHLTAALLHAGAGSGLCDETAVWWWGLRDQEPAEIHVCTTGRARSSGPVIVHHPREIETVRFKRLPVVPLTRALREFASHARDGDVRLALSEAEYRGRLDVEAVRSEIGRGRPGSRRLRRALARHEPRLARTRSDLEKLFLSVCERHGVPLPETNVRIGRMTVDAVWPAARVAVEIDGHRGHRTRAQLDRDRRRELILRRRGFTPLRYTEAQLEDEPGLVAADLLRILVRLSAC